MASEGGISVGPEPAPLVRNCISCGRPIDFSANVCPYCGYDYRMPTVPGPPPVRRSGTPVAGGVLVVIAGVLALVQAALLLTYSVADLESTGIALPPGVTPSDLLDIVRGCGVLEIVLGVVAMVGGVFAIQRRHFGLSIAGGLTGMVAIGLTFGGLLGLIGLILIAISRKEFQ